MIRANMPMPRVMYTRVHCSFLASDTGTCGCPAVAVVFEALGDAAVGAAAAAVDGVVDGAAASLVARVSVQVFTGTTVVIADSVTPGAADAETARDAGSVKPLFLAQLATSSPSSQQKPATGAQYRPLSQKPLSIAQHF